MSINLATAYVELIPTARGINGAVERQFAPAKVIAERAGAESGESFTQQAESRIRGGAGRIGSALKGVVTIGAAAVAAGGAVGLKTAAQLEQAEISFTTMLGSGEKAQAFLADLSTFAAKTPFDLPGLNKSAGSLISAGIEANKVIPIMTSLGNATSGMGTGAEGVQRATVAIQQMNAAGKIGAEDLNQLRDAGVPVFDLLTAATGKTTAEIAEMAAKGKLGRTELDQLMTALESGKGLEKFNGLMEAQSQSLTGLASTFKDTFEVGLAGAIEPLVPLIKTGLGGATVFLADVALPKLEAGLGKTVAIATDAYDILSSGNYEGNAAAFGIYEDSKLVDFLFDVREGLVAVGQGFAINQGAAHGLTEPLTGLVLVGHNLRTAWDESVGGFKAFGAAWRENTGDVTSSGFPGFMERVANAGRDVQGALGELDFTSVDAFLSSVSNLGGEAAPVVASIGGSFKELLPAVQAFADQAPSLATGGLKLLAAGLAFLAENVDTIIKYMPLIVAGFVAWKVATIALTAASAIAVPIQIALNVSRIAAARAEKGLAADLRQSIAALSGHTAATAVSAAATTTGAAASTAAAGATQRVGIMARLAAAGQWLLNAALSANPIGIVVVAIAGLVAGLVWFFTQTEIGQQIVQAAWAGIQLAVGAVVSWFTNHVAPVVGKVLAGIGSAVNWLWTNIFKPYFGFIGTALNAFGMLVGKIAEIAVAVIRHVLGAAFTWLWNSVISPVVGWISRALETAGVAWKVVFSGVQSFIRNTLAPAFTWLWRNVVKPALDGIGGVVSGVWNATLKPVFDFLSDKIGKAVPKAFDTGVAAIKIAWNKLKEIAKAPVRFVIEKVLNEGLIANVNKIARKVGVGTLPDVAVPEGFMNGGYTGDGPKHEVRGPAHAGEYIFTKEQTAALGKKNLAAMAHSAVRGGAKQAAGVSPTGAMPTLNTGFPGLIAHFGKNKAFVEDNSPGWQVPQAVGVINQMSGLKLAMARSGMPRIQTRISAQGMQPNWLAYAQANNVTYNPNGIGPGSSPTYKKAVSIHELLHVLGMGHTNQPSIMQPVMQNHMMPTAYDVAEMKRLYGGEGEVPTSNDGKGLLDLILGPFKKIADGILASIKEQFPGAGTFIDLAVGVGKTLMGGVVGFLEEAIGNLKNIATDIWDGVKNLFGGGEGATAPTLYDNGGLLQPGISLVENRTRRPEPILTGQQWDDLTEGGSDDGGHPPVVAQFYGADLDQGAQIADALWYSVKRRRRGGVYSGRRG